MIDNQGRLHVPVKRTSQPYEECGHSPDLQYELAGITGVLCKTCLQKEVDNVNRALQKTESQDEQVSEGES